MKAAPLGSSGPPLAVLLLAQRGASFALLGRVAAEGYSLPSMQPEPLIGLWRVLHSLKRLPRKV